MDATQQPEAPETEESLLEKGKNFVRAMFDKKVDYRKEPESTTKKTAFAILWKMLTDGDLSTKDFKDLTGRTVYIAGKRSYCKYTNKQLREMRARNGVGSKAQRIKAMARLAEEAAVQA